MLVSVQRAYYLVRFDDSIGLGFSSLRITIYVPQTKAHMRTWPFGFNLD